MFVCIKHDCFFGYAQKVFCCVTHNITYFRIEEAHQCRSKFNHVESCHHHVVMLRRFLYTLSKSEGKRTHTCTFRIMLIRQVNIYGICFVS